MNYCDTRIKCITLQHVHINTMTDLQDQIRGSLIGGDSDSTGAVTGNIIGTMVGYNAIPQYFKDNLELHDAILHIADDLWTGETTKFNS